jgi:hypothetical protein
MTQKLPASFRTTVRILHLAMLGSVVLYGVVAFVAFGQAEPGEPPEGLLLALIAASMAALAASQWLPGLIASDTVVLNAMRRGDPNKPLDGPTTVTGVDSERRLPPSQMHPLMAGASVMFPGFILRIVLIEAVAVFGLVLALLAQNPVYYLGFGAAAFVFIALARFDEERLVRLSRRL